MRGIRIAAFTFAALLASIAVLRILSLEPRPVSDTDTLDQPGPPPAVPPPPPVQGAPVSQPVQKHKTPSVNAPAPRIDAGQEPAPADARPIFLDADSHRDITNEVVPSPLAVTVAAAPQTTEEELKGPVIVVPHERPKQDSRGLRWLKAMGHALGIGNSGEDPAAQAFR